MEGFKVRTDWDKPFDWLSDTPWEWMADMADDDEYALLDDIWRYLSGSITSGEFSALRPKLSTDREVLKGLYDRKWQSVMANVLRGISDSLNSGELVLKVEWEE